MSIWIFFCWFVCLFLNFITCPVLPSLFDILGKKKIPLQKLLCEFTGCDRPPSSFSVHYFLSNGLIYFDPSPSPLLFILLIFCHIRLAQRSVLPYFFILFPLESLSLFFTNTQWLWCQTISVSLPISYFLHSLSPDVPYYVISLFTPQFPFICHARVV